MDESEETEELLLLAPHLHPHQHMEHKCGGYFLWSETILYTLMNIDLENQSWGSDL